MRSRSLMLLAYLFLGAIATVLCAWAEALIPLARPFPPVPLSVHPEDRKRAANHIEFCRLGGTRYEWLPEQPLDPATDFDELQRAWRDVVMSFQRGECDAAVVWEVIIEPYDWPAWSHPLSGRAGDSGLLPDQGRSVDARGFPFAALRCSTILQGSGSSVIAHPVVHGLPIRAPTGAINDPWSALPLEPLPLNFLLDTLFFAAAFFWTPRAVRTAHASFTHDRRARRQQCVSCAYPRTGLAPSQPCPECGRPP